MSHTKGPWEVSDYRHEGLADTEYHFIRAGDGICAEPYKGFEIAGCMSAEDARLIASAPCLLEALQIIVGDILQVPRDLTREQKLKIARAAISKATEEACTPSAI
jgi:hypothetical protein